MISALITIVVLVLGPGLAYGQSPAWLLRAASKSMRASVRATEAGWLQSALADLYAPVLSAERQAGSLPTSTATIRLRPRCRQNPCAAGSPGRSRRWSRLSSRIPASHANNPPTRLAVSRESSPGWSAGGAGLYPSVLKAVQPWLRGGYLDGSGAGDPDNNKHGTLRSEFCLPSSPESKPSNSSFIDDLTKSNWPLWYREVPCTAHLPARSQWAASAFSNSIVDSERERMTECRNER